MSIIETMITPKDIRIGRDIGQFVTLEDLYEICMKQKGFFGRLAKSVEPARTTKAKKGIDFAKARKQLASTLYRERLVLPEDCYGVLFKNLIQEKWIDTVKKGLRNKRGWKSVQVEVNRYEKKRHRVMSKGEDKPPGEPCLWPDCPNDDRV